MNADAGARIIRQKKIETLDPLWRATFGGSKVPFFLREQLAFADRDADKARDFATAAGHWTSGAQTFLANTNGISEGAMDDLGENIADVVAKRTAILNQGFTTKSTSALSYFGQAFVDQVEKVGTVLDVAITGTSGATYDPKNPPRLLEHFRLAGIGVVVAVILVILSYRKK